MPCAPLLLGALAALLAVAVTAAAVSGGSGGSGGSSDSSGGVKPGKPPSGNPFAGRTLYVNPTFTRQVRSSLYSAAAGPEKTNLAELAHVPSAYWLDLKWKVVPDNDSNTDTAAGILKDAASKPNPPLVTFVVYDLPNRDCKAKASNGEVCCGAKKPEGNCEYLDDASSGTCDKGLKEYRTEYIDPLAVSVKKYCGKVPMALVIEPDSIPNLVTNSDDPKCGSKATTTAYRTGVKYAVQTLAAACPEAAQYLDGAHGGWLGWPNNLEKFTTEVSNIGIHKYLRGFTTNVANYQPVGVKCPSVGFCLNGQNKDNPCCADPCGLATQFNPSHSELNYVAALAESMSKGIPGFSPKFVIDTSRNAQNPRSQCSNWCNVRGAGAGLRPTTKTGAPELVDFYHYVKTPGESDGCTEQLPSGGKCPRFDSDCASVDSIGSKAGEPRAPEAGSWFDYQIKMLARNAHL